MKEFVRTHKRAFLLGLAAVLLMGAAIGGTLAWLTSKPTGLINSFTPGEVPNKIVEKFDGDTKENVKIQNVGNVKAFIRVALVPVWRNADETTGAGIEPKLGVNYTMTLNTGSGETQWTAGGDGFYYYNSAVEPGLPSATTNLTGILVTYCAPVSPLPADCVGKIFELNVISQSIQAEGMGASNAQTAFAKALEASATSPIKTP